MWGVERLWAEALLLAAGFLHRWKVLPPLLLILYGLAIYIQREADTPLFYFASPNCVALLVFSSLTALVWLIEPLRGASAWALLLQMGSYGLLLRSVHLAFTWALMESAALAGYFLVASASVSPERWSAALRYLVWSVTGSALLLLGISLRLATEGSLTYPLSSGGMLSDGLLMMGWSIKVGFIPWHFWLIGIYRVLPVAWGGWFSVVPKGTLLLNLLSALPLSDKLHLELLYSLGALSLTGGYALAWRAERLTDMVFWGSFTQGAYTVLAATSAGKSAAWEFWLIYSAAAILGLLYAERPWGGRYGSAIGLLLLANLAALPPVMGFWVKVQLIWVGIQYLVGWAQKLLLIAAALGTIGGFAVYGKLLWRIWHGEAAPAPSVWRKGLYLVGGGMLLVGGFWGLGLWQ